MSFEKLIGNEPIKKRLEKMLDRGQVPHLLLFSGPEGVGKKLFALALAREWLRRISPKTLVETSFHPDLQVLHPEGKTGMLSINSVRKVIETLYHSPYEAGGKVVIFDEAERMLPSSANALLKVLEEPPKNTLIILVSSRPDQLLGTIRSRCQLMRFQLCPELQPADKKKDDVLEEALFTLLVELKDKNFAALASSCQNIQKLVEARRKEKEAALKEELPKSLKEMPASTRELLEHDIEGASALFWLQDVDHLLVSIYAFYRDLLAIHANHPSLHFAHKREELIQVYNQGRMLSLDRVDKQLQWAKQAIERHQPLQNVLETILLQM